MCMRFWFVDFRCRLWISSLFVAEQYFLKFTSFGIRVVYSAYFFLLPWFFALFILVAFSTYKFVDGNLHGIYLFEIHTILFVLGMLSIISPTERLYQMIIIMSV